MQLYLLRHGIAEDIAPDSNDALRSLTPEGIKKMSRAASGMRELIGEVNFIVSSPLKRARQTAEIVSEKLGYVSIQETDALKPESRIDELMEFVALNAIYEKILLVGHEPLLSIFASVLLGAGTSVIEFKKGSLCRIDLDGHPAKGKGLLIFHLNPKTLRSIK